MRGHGPNNAQPNKFHTRRAVSPKAPVSPKTKGKKDGNRREQSGIVAACRKSGGDMTDRIHKRDGDHGKDRKYVRVAPPNGQRTHQPDQRRVNDENGGASQNLRNVAVFRLDVERTADQLI